MQSQRARGRPISADLEDEAAQRKREQTRLRLQAYRGRIKEQKAQNRVTSLAQVTEQGIEEIEPTPLSIGLRLEGLSIQPIEEEEVRLQAGISIQEDRDLSTYEGLREGVQSTVVAIPTTSDEGPRPVSYTHLTLPTKRIV